MIEPTRTPFAPSAPPATFGNLYTFPASAIVRPAPGARPDGDEVRVEYRGRVKVYRDRQALAAELTRRPTLGELVCQWGWLAVPVLCAAVVLRGGVQ